MAIFTVSEATELKLHLKNGGVIIESSTYYGEPAKVLKCRDDGSFEAIGILDEAISGKLYELYPDSTPMSYHLIGTKSIIDKFC